MLEEYQNQRLKLIKEILPLFGENFVLKGGTALNLYYNLNRYSEDLDFDCLSSNMNFINKLKKHKDFPLWKINIKKDTETVFRALLDYGAKSHLGLYPLKIEVSSRNKNLLRENNLNVELKNGVKVYSVDEIIRMKVVAFSGRDKIRDLYDLNFLIDTYPEHFSQESLFAIHEKISYAGIEELNLLLQEEVELHKLVSKDIISITDDYVKNMVLKIEQMRFQPKNQNNSMKIRRKR